MQLAPEQLRLAQSCTSADELVAKAKEAGIEITAAQAAIFMDSQANCDVSIEDLDTVAGGTACWFFRVDKCQHCGSESMRLESTPTDENGTLWCEYVCNDCHRHSRIEA